MGKEHAAKPADEHVIPHAPADAPDTAAQAEPVPRLRIRAITKSYEGIHALKDVSFDVQPGEIHALVGENGAGKSTMVKIITGLVVPDGGVIELDGAPVAFETPMQARDAGVSAVYQDPKLFPHLDIAENVFMGIFPRGSAGTINRRAMYSETERLLDELNVDLSPTALVAGLSVAELQFVGIARILTKELGLLILDEPTAALTPSEAARLFSIVHSLRDRGTSVIFISHRLEELAGFVDSVTVLRDGQLVQTSPINELDQAGIVRLMVGRSLENLYRRAGDGDELGEERLRLEGLSLTGAFRDITFSVRAGEVVTLAGLVGAGRTEIAQALFGIAPAESGRVWIDGNEVKVENARQMLRHGLAYLPEDRDRQGLITEFSIEHNITLPIIRRLSRFGFVQRSAERAAATTVAADLDVRMKSVDQIVAELSGGNRQKVVIGKWLAAKPRVLILDEPTHGIDVGTKAQVHDLIADLAKSGLAVLVISSDLPEVLAISSRILVINEGLLVAEFDGAAATQEAVMTAATAQHEAVA